jgi:hypothetical protein
VLSADSKKLEGDLMSEHVSEEKSCDIDDRKLDHLIFERMDAQ